MMTLRQQITLSKSVYPWRGWTYACRIGWRHWRLMRAPTTGPVDRHGLDERQRRAIINRAVDAKLPPAQRTAPDPWQI
jgi:hypothetical protein